jgi:hypothetical protein
MAGRGPDLVQRQSNKRGPFADNPKIIYATVIPSSWKRKREDAITNHSRIILCEYGVAKATIAGSRANPEPAKRRACIARPAGRIDCLSGNETDAIGGLCEASAINTTQNVCAMRVRHKTVDAIADSDKT